MKTKILITAVLCCFSLCAGAQDKKQIFVDRPEFVRAYRSLEEMIIRELKKDSLITGSDTLKFVHLFVLSYDERALKKEDFIDGSFINYLRPRYIKRDEFPESFVDSSPCAYIPTTDGEGFRSFNLFKIMGGFDMLFPCLLDLIRMKIAGDLDYAFWISGTSGNHLFLVKGEEVKAFDPWERRFYSMEEFVNEHWYVFSAILKYEHPDSEK